MAVNLSPPDAAHLHPVSGLELGIARAGIKKQNRKDLLLIRVESGATAAGVFTRNRFCAAPVVLAKKRVAGDVRALVVNTGNANAGTGADGLKRAAQVCATVAKSLGCRPEQVLPFSTGVIMEPLPVERITAGLAQAVADFGAANWASAAEAIMTTDTVAKAASRKVRLSSGEAVVTTGGAGSSRGRGTLAGAGPNH